VSINTNDLFMCLEIDGKILATRWRLVEVSHRPRFFDGNLAITALTVDRTPRRVATVATPVCDGAPKSCDDSRLIRITTALAAATSLRGLPDAWES
jgi:hypothetical protein